MADSAYNPEVDDSRIVEINEKISEFEAVQKAEERSLSSEEDQQVTDLLEEFDAISLRKDAAEAEAASAKKEEQLLRLKAHSSRQSDPDSFEDNEPQLRGTSRDRKPSYNVGDQLLAIRSATQGVPPSTMSNVQQRALRASVMSCNDGCDGGFLLSEVFAKDLTRKMFDSSDMLSRVQRRNLGLGELAYNLTLIDETSRQNGMRGGGLDADWVSGKRCETVDPSKMALRQVRIIPEMLRAALLECQSCCSSNELADLVQQELPKEMSFRIEEAILFGDGIRKPLGMLSDKNPAKLTVPAATRAATVNAYYMEDITALEAAFCGRSGIFLANRQSLPQLRCMKKADSGTQVDLLFVGPTQDMSGGAYTTLSGLPLVFDERMPIYPAAGSIALVDPSQYIVVDRQGGISGESSMHAFFLQHMMAYRFEVCINGLPKWACPVQTYADATKFQSPYVVLGAITP